MTLAIKISSLSEHLFWDTNRDELDFEVHKKYIIKNVLMYGELDDWKKIVTIYGISTITDIISKAKGIDNKSLSFISTVSGVPLENFEYYTTKQSPGTLWNY